MSMWDDEAGYDLDDPKHPTYGERMVDFIDEERKRRKENGDGPGNPDWERDFDKERE